MSSARNEGVTPRFSPVTAGIAAIGHSHQREDFTRSLGKSFVVALFVAAVALLASSWVPARAQTVPPVPPILPPIQPTPLSPIQIPDPEPPTYKPPDLKPSQNLSGRSRSDHASAALREPVSVGVPAKIQEAYDAYRIAALQQRTAAFAWQAFASTIIFWLVVVLVLSGIAFSGIQFWFGLRRGTPEDSGEVDVSLDGLKVRSQFLGVVTLALSLAFFYLYLKTVYPIVEAADTTATAHDKR